MMAIKLEKSGDFHPINLRKSEPLIVRINLDWEATPITGIFAKIRQGNQPDLDLGCMYELGSGQKGVIQPLGNSFGSKTMSPYIFLDQDDRTGETEGENMTVYRPDLVKRVLFFGFIYKGALNFESVQGRMYFQVSNGEEVHLELNNPERDRAFCAAAILENIEGQMIIRKEEKYFSDHLEADHYYGFGFDWVAGSKYR